MNYGDFLLKVGTVSPLSGIVSQEGSFSGTIYKSGVQSSTRKFSYSCCSQKAIITIKENNYGAEFNDSYSTEWESDIKLNSIGESERYMFDTWLDRIYTIWVIFNAFKSSKEEKDEL